jgi:hypothetical protein
MIISVTNKFVKRSCTSVSRCGLTRELVRPVQHHHYPRGSKGEKKVIHSAITEKPSTKFGEADRPFLGGLGFDRLMAVLISCLIGGIYVDGWAHVHGLVDKTFFTPWHGLLYGADFVCALTLAAVVGINHQRGWPWLRAIPHGYEFSMLGAPLFLVAGVGDLIWHTLFGIEANVDALLSPTHLLLAFSVLLILAGPLRAAWQRTDAASTHSWRTLLPALVSLLAVFSLFTFFTRFAHPFAWTVLVTDGRTNGEHAWGVAAVLLQAAILMGLLLFALRRWHLPLGTFTFVFTLNAVLVGLKDDAVFLIPAVLLAGGTADLLAWFLRPAVGRVAALRVFAFCVPVVYYLGYFLTLWLTSRIAWSIHLWLGSLVMAGIIGLTLSYLLLPPASSLKYEE